MNTEGKKAVLVSLVTYNDEAFLARCLEAVQNQSIPIRVKIFDNASQDGTRDIAQSFGVPFHQSRENLGYSFRDYALDELW